MGTLMDTLLPVSAPLAINAALCAAGIPKRQDQAKMLGISPTLWSRYLNGHRSPQCAMVQGWLARLDEQGHHLVLTWDARGGFSANG